MNILVACEYSARVRDAFTKKGHNVWSCDLLDTDGGGIGYHYKGDVSELLSFKWDMLIAHPPCTYLAVSGLHWNKRQPERAKKTDDALKFIELLWASDIEKKCVENPVGCINSRLWFMPKPQYIQQYDFGEDASKKTGLWLENLPDLEPTKRIAGRMVGDKERWANQTDSGQNNLAPSKDRWKLRSTTPLGVADAMADQWG